jgi:hypothetical protein
MTRHIPQRKRWYPECVINDWRIREESTWAYDVSVENLKTGFSDVGLVTDDGRILWDWPESVPQYVQEEAYKLIFRKHQ